ncbi:tetratricopeptide repeat protein [Chitinilyticum piscinae]|uniref:Tetratricopeptide repeat protein n=1 Tax=Chitinilyticum piscinae TaxID=2866724 RepID=A0A8J7G3F9_9NEIS|nr:tetratricopeptide repeat protein [Chitinilyticum piscinae]MBE9610673.1 tetratricopeptide repeat protein [Chitinilyticum piscinae]
MTRTTSHPLLEQLGRIALHDDHSETELQAALAELNTLPDEELKLQGLLLCGEYYCNRQLLHDAARFFREAANRARQLHLWSVLAHAQHWQAQIKLLQGEHLRALDTWLHSLDHAIDSEDDSAFVRAYSGIGQVCFAYQQYEQALIYQTMACTLAERLSQPDLVLTSRLNLLSTLYRNGQYDEADTILALLENQLDESHSPVWHCECMTYRGLLTLARGQHADALEQLRQAQELNQHHGSHFSDALSSIGLGRIHLALRQLEQARRHLEHALDLSRNFPGLTLQLESHELLEQVAEQQHDFASALTHHKEKHHLQMDMLRKQVEQRLNRISQRQLAPLEHLLRLERHRLRYAPPTSS